MTKKAKLLLVLAKWTAAFALLTILLADLHFELNGLPDQGVGLVRGWLARQGVNCEIRTVRAGLFRGVVLSDLRVRVDRFGVPLIFACRDLRFRPFLGKLLRGTVSFRTAAVSSGRLQVLDHTPDSAAGRVALSVVDIEGMLHILRSNRVGLELSGNAEGVKINVSGTIRNMSRLAATRPGSHRPGGPLPANDGTEDPTAAKGLPPQIRDIVEFVRTCDLTERDAVITTHVDIDAADVRGFKASGDIRLYDAVVGGVVIRRFRTAFRATREEVLLDNASLLLSRDERVTGAIRVDPQQKTIQGKLSGELTPATALYVLRLDPEVWPEGIEPDMPVSFTASLDRSPMRPAEWTVRGTARILHAKVRELPIQRASLNYEVSAGTCRLTDIEVLPGGAEDDEYVRGSLSLDLDDKRLKGWLDCAFHVPTRISQIDPGFGRRLHDVRTGAVPLTLHIELAESPFTWEQWDATGTLSAPELIVGGLHCWNVVGALELNEGTLRLDGLHWQWPGTPPDFAALDLATNLVTAVRGERVDLDFGLRAKVPPVREGDTGPWRRGLDITGQARVRDRNKLSASFEGELYPDAVFEVARQTFRWRRRDVVEKLRCLGDPVEVSVHVPEFVLNSRKWIVSGALSGSDVRYDLLELLSVRSSFSVSPKDISFTDIVARTATDVDLSLDVSVNFDPLQVRISKGLIVGDPEVVQAFVEPAEARAIYRRVWRDFRWDAAVPPRVSLPSLVYRDAAGSNWQLKMESSLEAKGATYKDLRTESLALDVTLNLPKQIRVENARIRTANGLAKGQVIIGLEGTPQCDFRLTEVEGGADPKRILHLINADWDGAMNDITFAPNSEVVCRGSFFLQGDPMVRVDGTLKTPYASYRDMELRDVDCQWRVTPAGVSWDVTKSTFFKGKLTLTGLYETGTRRGQIALNADRLSFPDFLEHFNLKPERKDLPGFISGTSRLQFLRGWAGQDVQLVGNGRLSITESDLWSVPLFTKLGKLLDMTLLNRLTGGRLSSLGTISRLDADLAFSGDRLLVPSLATDGSIVSLRGSGEYCWASHRLFFQVTGQTLRKIGVLSFALRPLSWVFNAELTGTTEDHNWRLVTAFQKALSGKSEQGLPPLDEIP